MSWVFDCSKSENATRLVALALADHADDYGRCWPGYQRIAEKTRLSLRSIGRAIADLVELGEVEIVREHYKGKQTKIYQMKQPDNLSSSQIVAKIASTPDNLSKQPDNLSPITVINRQQDEPSNKQSSPKKQATVLTNAQKTNKQILWNKWQEEYQKHFPIPYKNNGADWKMIHDRGILDIPQEKLLRIVELWFIGFSKMSKKYYPPYLRSLANGWERTGDVEEEITKSTKSSKDDFNKFSGWDNQ